MEQTNRRDKMASVNYGKERKEEIKKYMYVMYKESLNKQEFKNKIIPSNYCVLKV